MQTPENSYFERVREILVDQLGISSDDVKPESDLIADLGADSLDTVEIVMALENSYDVEVPDEIAEKLVTVSAITDFLEEKLGPCEDAPKVDEPERKLRQDMTFGEAGTNQRLETITKTYGDRETLKLVATKLPSGKQLFAAAGQADSSERILAFALTLPDCPPDVEAAKAEEVGLEWHSTFNGKQEFGDNYRKGKWVVIHSKPRNKS